VRGAERSKPATERGLFVSLPVSVSFVCLFFEKISPFLFREWRGIFLYIYFVLIFGK
jgi:hypothetical protein